MANLSARIEARYEQMYEQAVQNLDEMLREKDDRQTWRAATFRMIDQKEGKPVQRVKTDSTSSHTEIKVVAIPGLDRLITAVQQSARLLTPAQYTPALPAASEDYQDAELVDGGEPEGGERAA
jgi:hypothetical protein